MVRQAAELAEADIEAVFPGALARRELVSWDANRQAVSGIAGFYYRDFCLRAAGGAQVGAEAVAACLAEHLRPEARALIAEDEAAGSFLARCAWLRHWMPDLGLPAFDDAQLRDLVDQLCAGCRSRAEVAAKPKLPWLEGQLTHQQRRAVAEHAPERLAVPSGSQIRLQYDEVERPPVLAVRLQELFGLAETPRIAHGRVALVLHLLGPNYRAEQITQDLASFWANTYPQVRKDLRSRYPKHSWPEDPLTAPAVAKGRPRQ
jgi:ATP-dependent helicase HrpB